MLMVRDIALQVVFFFIRSVLGKWRIHYEVLLRIFHQHLPATWEKVTCWMWHRLKYYPRKQNKRIQPCMSKSCFCDCLPCRGFAQWKKPVVFISDEWLLPHSKLFCIAECCFRNWACILWCHISSRIHLAWDAPILKVMSPERRRVWRQDEVWEIMFLFEPYSQGSL